MSAISQDNGACRFTVRYSAAERDAAKSADIRLSYGIKSKTPVGATFLRLAATPLRLSTTDAPRVHVLAFDPRWTHKSVTVNNVKVDSLQWEVKFDVEDAGNPINDNAPMLLDEPTLTCGQIRQPANVAIDHVGGSRLGAVRISRPIFDGDAFDEAADPVQCTFSSGLRLTLAGAATVQRGIAGVQVRFPATRVIATVTKP